MRISFADLPTVAAAAGVLPSHGVGSRYAVFDLWQGGKSLGVKATGVSAEVPGTAAAFYKLVPKE